MARGSNGEVQTQLAISKELSFGGEESRAAVISLFEEVSRMLIAIMKKLRE
jgi:four helix bundle protein